MDFGGGTSFGGGAGKDVGGEHGVAHGEMHPVKRDGSEDAETGGCRWGYLFYRRFHNNRVRDERLESGRNSRPKA